VALRTRTAALVAERYALGPLAGEPVYAARGELGLIWRVDTESGSWAVKELLIDVPEADAALDELVTPPSRATTCHRDLGPDNLRMGADGAIVVLDWENCGPCEPVRELAGVLADLDEPGAAQAYAAYRDGGGPATIARPEDFSTAIAVQAHLLEFYARRAVDGTQSRENRDRAAGRLTAMLAGPLTRERIDRLLGVL
jgi:thiamine kinase-like enzyme